MDVIIVSLNENVSHSFDTFFSIVWFIIRHVTTRTIDTKETTNTKPDSGIARPTVDFVVANNTDSCFGAVAFLHHIESFLVAVKLQRPFGTKQ